MVDIETSLSVMQIYYGERRALRSGVPLINHIIEGRRVMKEIEASEDAIIAYTLHPMFQTDYELKMSVDTGGVIHFLTHNHIILLMEYRNIANRSLSDIVSRGRHGELFLERDIILSPLTEVNKMLIGDKVQNRKDFEKYHKDKLPNSDELDFYFKQWLKALDISEERYSHLCVVANSVYLDK